jgi:hypothetical protein
MNPNFNFDAERVFNAARPYRPRRRKLVVSDEETDPLVRFVNRILKKQARRKWFRLTEKEITDARSIWEPAGGELLNWRAMMNAGLVSTDYRHRRRKS